MAFILNEWDVEECVDRFSGDPVLGPAANTLQNLVRWTNRNSDGWPYWAKPSRASSQLQEILHQAMTQLFRRDRDYVAPTAKDVRKSYTPIKAFLTRYAGVVAQGDRPEIIEP